MERPIIFSGPMVRAILGGRKTQTRRVVKQKPYFPTDPGIGYAVEKGRIKCPYGVPGDRLYLRETWAVPTIYNHLKPSALPCQLSIDDIWYFADGDRPTGWGKTRQSIFMPRWASRITLKVTGVRVEQLQNISYSDVIKEGIGRLLDEQQTDAAWKRECRDGFRELWDSINAKKHPWESNPFVWCISFRKI